MALIKSLIAQSVHGNHRVEAYNIDPDNSATSFATGMNNIAFAQVTVKSGAAFVASGNTGYSYPVISENSGESGTAIAGTLGMSGLVASTVYRVVVYGSS